MSRRTRGPKRRAEAYGYRIAGLYEGLSGSEISHALAAAYMAGYNSAISEAAAVFEVLTREERDFLASVIRRDE